MHFSNISKIAFNSRHYVSGYGALVKPAEHVIKKKDANYE